MTSADHSFSLKGSLLDWSELHYSFGFSVVIGSDTHCRNLVSVSPIPCWLWKVFQKDGIVLLNVLHRFLDHVISS